MDKSILREIRLCRRVRALGGLLAGCLIAVASAPSAAQPYPNRPIRLIVPFAPAGPTDIVGRIVGQALSQRLGQPVLIENRPGAGSMIGTETAIKSAPDGYTLLLGSSSLTINPSVFPKVPYNAVRDLAPIILVARIPNVLTVHPSVRANNVNEFLALARLQPGKIRFGTSGHGTADHLIGVLFASTAKVDLTDVPYKSAAPMLTDLMGGQFEATFNSLASTIQHIRSGRLRALGVTSATRSASAPEIPTIAESGLSGFETGAWFGIFAPAQTPPEILNRLNADLAAALDSPAVRERFAAVGAEPDPLGREPFTRMVRDETANWAKLIKDSNLKFD